MINPWQIYFETFMREISKTQEKKMRPYEVKFQTTAEVSVFVDASSEDEALEYAWDLLDEADATFKEWECIEVDYE